MREERDGEAADPGPMTTPLEEMDTKMDAIEQEWRFDNDKDLVIVESINATSFATNLEQIRGRKAHITAFQEHAMSDEQIHAIKLSLGTDGWNMQAGPRDPEHARKTGGGRHAMHEATQTHDVSAIHGRL